MVGAAMPLVQQNPSCHSSSTAAAVKRYSRVAERRPVVMVTGGAGFIGCHTVAALLAGGLHDVLLVDNLSSHGYPSSVKAANLQKRYHIQLGAVRSRRLLAGRPLPSTTHSQWLQERALECSGSLQIEQKDITDRMAMKSVFSDGVDVVCHLAAHAGARESIASPESCINTNASTGAPKQCMAVMREESVLGKPLSPYATSKVAAEGMAAVYHHLYKLPTTGLRFFTIYGPRGRPEMVPLKFMSLIYKGLPIEQYGDGSTWRDYTYVDDAVDAILAAIEKPHDCETFNIGAGKPVYLSEFISALEKVMGRRAIIIQKEEAKGDIGGTFADIQKARQMLGYDPKVDLEEGLGRLFAWFKGNTHT